MGFTVMNYVSLPMWKSLLFVGTQWWAKERLQSKTTTNQLLTRQKQPTISVISVSSEKSKNDFLNFCQPPFFRLDLSLVFTQAYTVLCVGIIHSRKKPFFFKGFSSCSFFFSRTWINDQSLKCEQEVLFMHLCLNLWPERKMQG